ncbi:mannitol-1-phosphate 5-dehydrogenase [Paenibacillus sp. GCM10012306]|uniref:mannitol-1-phosphate 5-dehydrogenase n=1 Tax=Paenibacillus sp. GCM10012306 TaxID=3317342 RepID=UPI003615E37C
MKAVHFGAGNIGRGFIGNVLSKAGFEVCFVDVNQEMIDTINKTNSYKVELLDADHTIEVISPVSALNSMTQEEEVIANIGAADLITLSVGVPNLSKVANILLKALLARAELRKDSIDIIANENAINASTTLRQEIERLASAEEMATILSIAGFPNAAVDRLALSRRTSEGDLVQVEPFFEWIINRSEMLNHSLPLLDKVIYVDDLTPYIERKLFIVNMGHAAAAYLGFLFDEPTIQRALTHPDIEATVQGAMYEVARYFEAAYGKSAEELKSFIETTCKRFRNEQVSDDIFRVGRSPIRKLGVDERLVKPATELYKRGLPYSQLAKVIAAGYLFRNTRDEEAVELQDYIAEQGLISALAAFSHITEPEVQEVIRQHVSALIAVSK